MKKYFNIGKYDNLFFDKIMERGAEIYLSDKIFDLKQNENNYSCKVQGTDIYEVNVSFKDNKSDEIDKITCTCPFAQEGNNCKHMYALLLKLKCNYNLDTIKKDIKKGLKELKQTFNDFDRDYVSFKYKNPKYLKDIENLKEQMNCFKTMYDKIAENNNNNTNEIVVLKDIINLTNTVYERIDNFNKYILLKVKTSAVNNTKEYSKPVVKKDKSLGLFGLFVDVLDSVNKAEEKREKEYEEIKQSYRRVIKEQNLYDGKTNEDIYDGLDD